MNDFLDKVKQGLDKGVTVVSVRSKEALEAARLKAKIGTLADRKKDILEELGSLVYAAFTHEGLDLGTDAKAKAEEIAGLDAEIKGVEEELRRVHREAKQELGIPVCPSCQGELTEDDKFCRKCGAKVERDKEE